MIQISRIALMASLSITMFGCTGSKETVTAKTENPTSSMTSSEPQMLATIQRTACYGQCPIYKATFMDNGEVIYVGKMFVEKIGTYKGLLSAQDVVEITNKITEYEYYALDSLYPTPITDFPSCITEVNLNGELKRVINRRNPPDNLKAFEKFLDSLLLKPEFEKISDQTDFDRSSY
ncbi:MAG: hypothetical protein RL266_1490 [Bacteroidota bacterium]